MTRRPWCDSAANYPLVLAGGRNLGLQHGEFHRFEHERPFNDLLLTLLQQVGVETDSFGDSERTRRVIEAIQAMGPLAAQGEPAAAGGVDRPDPDHR